MDDTGHDDKLSRAHTRQRHVWARSTVRRTLSRTALRCFIGVRACVKFVSWNRGETAVAGEVRALFVPERECKHVRSQDMSLPLCVRTGQTPRLWFCDSILRPMLAAGFAGVGGVRVVAACLGGSCLVRHRHGRTFLVLAPCLSPPLALLKCAALWCLTATQHTALPQSSAPY